MCSGIGMPGNSTTGRGKSGNSRTPRTLSKASLMNARFAEILGKLSESSNGIKAKALSQTSCQKSAVNACFQPVAPAGARVRTVIVCRQNRFVTERDYMSELADRQCVPCRGGVPPLKGNQVQKLLGQLADWQAVSEHHLLKTYRFENFRETLAFVNRVGALAEEQGHHPDICFGWGKAEISIWTHKIDGLTESDFVLAAKIDKL